MVDVQMYVSVVLKVDISFPFICYNRCSRRHVVLDDGTSSAAVTIPTSGPPRSRYRPSSCEACVDLYNTVKDAVLSSTNATSLQKALEDLNIPKRTFNRKRPVAELYLLDQQAFQRARDDIAAASGGRRINQEKLAKQCSDILKTRDMQVRRRVAVTQGILI